MISGSVSLFRKPSRSAIRVLSKTGTSPGFAWGAKAQAVLHMAAVHFLRHFTAGLRPSIWAWSCCKAWSRSGNFCTSLGSVTWLTCSVIASKPPRITAGMAGALFMASITDCRPTSCPSAIKAVSSAFPPAPRMLKRSSASGVPCQRIADNCSALPFDNTAKMLEQARTSLSSPLPRSVAPRSASTRSGAPPSSTRSLPRSGSDWTRQSMAEQHAC
mmetsp:Transcript_84194/g.234808  ORF Transcript_84194/g.234808 Transcript_84194/m.234808 type:complete len:216 (+) Transcript_84194:1063-1710(+)